jgi:hypothetical protein
VPRAEGPWFVGAEERELCLLKENAEGTYKTKHAEAARLDYTTTHRHIDTKTEPHQSLSSDTLVKVIALPVILGNTELQVTRHNSMAAREVGGATDRNSLSTREPNGATMLVEVDTAAVTKLLLVWFIAEVREVVGSLLIRNEVEQPQELAENATPEVDMHAGRNASDRLRWYGS